MATAPPHHYKLSTVKQGALRGAGHAGALSERPVPNPRAGQVCDDLEPALDTTLALQSTRKRLKV